MKPLRFCMVTTFYPPYNFGGDGIFVHRLSNELARRGHHVEVVHCIDAYRFLAGRAPASGYDNHPNIVLHSLKSRFGWLSPLVTQQTGFPLLKARRLRELLNQDFDVIHYHNISLIGGPGILAYGDAIKLYTTHEYWLVCPTHVLFKFNRAPCTRRSCLACMLSYKRPPNWWRYSDLLQRSVKHVNAFIAPSRFCKDIHGSMGFKNPMSVLPNFAPGADEQRSKCLNPAERVHPKPYFLFAGRLEKLKGAHTLIPVFRRFPKADLLIAGSGTGEAELKKLAASSPNIQFLGHVPERKLQQLYRDAVAVIVPSICYEIFSLVVIEAFRHQTPAIVRQRGGMPELIAESGGGAVYDTDDQLLAAMERLLDSSYRRRLGALGYQAYQKLWTPEAHLRGYFDLITQLAAATGRQLPRDDEKEGRLARAQG
jgi:glycosyltransferase involved in cell wall biosynthesis